MCINFFKYFSPNKVTIEFNDGRICPCSQYEDKNEFFFSFLTYLFDMHVSPEMETIGFQ